MHKYVQRIWATVSVSAGVTAQKQLKSVFSEASSATQRQAKEMLKLFQFGVQFAYHQ